MQRSTRDRLAVLADQVFTAGGILGARTTKDGDVVVLAEWGQEAPDSPMVAAAAYGVADTLDEAINQACDEARIEAHGTFTLDEVGAAIEATRAHAHTNAGPTDSHMAVDGALNNLAARLQADADAQTDLAREDRP